MNSATCEPKQLQKIKKVTLVNFRFFGLFMSALCVFLFLIKVQVAGEVKFEGVRPFDREVTFKNLVERVVICYLPYNPVIMELRGRSGENTQFLAKKFPKGHLIVFEPDLSSFEQLVVNTESLNNISAFNLDPGPYLNLDTWCRANYLNHVDLIRLDADGFELQIIKSAPDLLKTVSVVFTKTNPGKGATSFMRLKKHLENQGFCLLSHWYEEMCQGEAIFISKRIYDSIYR